jgi:ribose-phosphate pyrophosphokinase
MRVTTFTKGGFKIADHNIDVGLYSDNTPFAKAGSLFESKYETPNKAIIEVSTISEFHAAMMLGHTLKDLRWSANLYMPFAFGARQDRRNISGDILFGAKYYADIINAVGFNEVAIVDPHSNVIAGLINNRRIISAGDVLRAGMGAKFGSYYAGVIAPDAGASARAYDVAEKIGAPKVIQAWKHRDVADGHITGFGIEPIEAGEYLIVDDICDGGGTFNGLASILPEGVVCDLYVTHGIFSQGLRELRKNFKRIITTDSLPNYETELTIIRLKEYFNV